MGAVDAEDRVGLPLNGGTGTDNAAPTGAVATDDRVGLPLNGGTGTDNAAPTGAVAADDRVGLPLNGGTGTDNAAPTGAVAADDRVGLPLNGGTGTDNAAPTGAVAADDRVGLPLNGGTGTQNAAATERVSLPLMGAPPPPPVEPVSLTPRAVRAFTEILEQKGETHGALKVAVTGGGCAGNQYEMALARVPEPTDIVISSGGIDVYLDGHTAHMMVGAQIDFVDSMMGRGFTVRNPNAQATCGCGSSFNTSGTAPVEGGCVK